MALRKRTLILFLEGTKNTLTHKIEDKYYKLYQDTREKLYQDLGIDTQLKEHQKCINTICEYNYKNLVNSPLLKEKGIMIQTYYHSPLMRLNNLSKESYFLKMKESIDFSQTTEMKTLQNKKMDEINNICSNYNKLITVCRSMNSGKKIQAYLEGLGFDLTELKKQDSEEVSLICPVNVESLGIDLVNKLNNNEKGENLIDG